MRLHRLNLAKSLFAMPTCGCFPSLAIFQKYRGMGMASGGGFLASRRCHGHMDPPLRPKQRSSLCFAASAHCRFNFQQLQRVHLYSASSSSQKRGSKSVGRSLKSSKSITKQKLKDSVISPKSSDHLHIQWWLEKMHVCKKPATNELIKRLCLSNLLGLNESRKNGKLKEGSLNSELLQVKWKFPREVLLCRVGEFYEAVGFDACILVEYAGLNPMGGLRGDSVPKAGCPVLNLRQTLDDLTRNGFSVCVFEEVQGPALPARRKDRFVSGHAHPGSPYVYGLAGADIDVDFSESVPVIGISRSARGYCFISVLEAMQTYSAEDGLTEEAVVAKLRARNYHSLFLHSSLRKNSSGTYKWSAFGEGGSLWSECNGKHFEWISGDPVSELLCKALPVNYIIIVLSLPCNGVPQLNGYLTL